MKISIAVIVIIWQIKLKYTNIAQHDTPTGGDEKLKAQSKFSDDTIIQYYLASSSFKSFSKHEMHDFYSVYTAVKATKKETSLPLVATPELGLI